jgi:hypothetical protein
MRVAWMGIFANSKKTSELLLNVEEDGLQTTKNHRDFGRGELCSELP